MEAPVTVPTRPLARSRRSSGTRSVTSVGRAIDRGLPAMTPVMSSTMSTHSCQEPTSAKLRPLSSRVLRTLKYSLVVPMTWVFQLLFA